MIIRAIKKQIEVSKAGKPYARVLIQFDEYADGKGNRRWLSGFGNQTTWAWKVGDDVQPVITEEGKYLNFEFEGERLDIYRLPATIGFVLDLLQGRKEEEPKDEWEQNHAENVPF